MPLHTQIAAHRGGAQLWPENSRQAFRNAVRMDVDFVEFDVHRTRDGMLVVHHDAVLGRTCEGRGAICDLDWSVLRTLKLDRTNGETIPTLHEVLDILEPGQSALRLEIKYLANGERYPGLERDVLAVLRDRKLLARTTFTAFDVAVLHELAVLAPERPSIHLIRGSDYESNGRKIGQYVEAARDRGVRELAIRVDHIEEGDVEHCEKFGVALGVYAAHDVHSIARAFDLRASVFTTDRPDLAIDVRNRRALG